MWPTFDQDLTEPLVKCYLKRGRSKVSQVDYPLTNIRLIISGQCYECMLCLTHHSIHQKGSHSHMRWLTPLYSLGQKFRTFKWGFLWPPWRR